MLNAEYTSQFKRDLKLAKKRNKNLNALSKIMKSIQEEKPLDLKLKDHSLSGNWNGHRELHLESDWFLVYKISKTDNTVVFVRIGTHSDLFK